MMGTIGTELGTTSGNMSPEMRAEMKEEKEEAKRESALRDALYALNQVQQLSVLNPEYASDPRFMRILVQVRDNIDKLMSGTASEVLEPAEPGLTNEEEPETEVGTGPITEDRARGLARKMGFGARRSAYA